MFFIQIPIAINPKSSLCWSAPLQSHLPHLFFFHCPSAFSLYHQADLKQHIWNDCKGFSSSWCIPFLSFPFSIPFSWVFFLTLKVLWFSVFLLSKKMRFLQPLLFFIIMMVSSPSDAGKGKDVLSASSLRVGSKQVNSISHLKCPISGFFRPYSVCVSILYFITAWIFWPFSLWYILICLLWVVNYMIY